MGTFNFLYRDTLYAIDDDEYDEYDEFNYEYTKYVLINDLDTIGKGKTIGTIYGVKDGYSIKDNRNFPAVAIGYVYKDFDIELDCVPGRIYLSVGDDLCLRRGYYSGFNFDRVTSRYATYGTDELDAVKQDLHDTIYKYDELRLSEEIAAGNLTEEEVKELKDNLYKETIADIEDFIAEADNVYNSLGKKYFENYRELGRFNNGEAVYERA